MSATPTKQNDSFPQRGRRVDISGRRVITQGLPRHVWQDLYHYFMTVSWPRLFATFATFFVLFNLAFALLYSLQPGDIANENPRGYWGTFFFSVETLATVGYGDMHPQTVFSHVVAAGEIFTGLMSLALITGMMFARFSRPTARFLFAKIAVVRTLDGRRTLMLRAANARQNIVMEAAAQLRLIRDEITREGYRIRRIYDLKLVRSHHPVFVFGWNLLHVVDEASPLAGENAASLAASQGYLLLTVSGFDETTGQQLMARHNYRAQDILWGYAFVDILHTAEDGVDHFDYTHFHHAERMDEAAP